MKKISRRDFLKVTGLVGAAAALTACGGSASSTAASTASSAAGSAAASTAALGADTQAIVDRGVLKVGVKNAVKGFSFQDTLTGEYKGLEDSLAEMIAEHLGVDVEFTTVTAATRGELLDSGDIDAVLATFTITEERKKTWDFSTPYYTDYVSVLVEDSTGIKGLADLKDKVVGVSSGSTSTWAGAEAGASVSGTEAGTASIKHTTNRIQLTQGAPLSRMYSTPAPSFVSIRQYVTAQGVCCGEIFVSGTRRIDICRTI